jgi:hypothetical protein
MRILMTLALLVTLGACDALAQEPRDRTPASVTSGTGVIAGVVLTLEATPRPLRRAVVTLSGAALAEERRVATDDEGRFAFGRLPAGRYTLTAEKPAYVKTFYGSRRVGLGPPSPIALADGQEVTAITIPLMRGAVIEGTIRDEHGVPLASAQASVLQPTIVEGERRLVRPPGRVQFATTDDRGRYRIYGLPPGEYTVRAGGGGGVTGGVRLTTAAMVAAAQRGDAAAIGEAPLIARTGVYYPGVADADRAEFFTLGPGEERTGVDVTNPLVRSSRVEGMAVGPAGEPLQDVMVGIANLSAGALWGSPGMVRPGPDGRFALPSMTPGRYQFLGLANPGRTSTAPGGLMQLWTSTEFFVDQEDVVHVVLTFAPGARVGGRLRFEGASAVPDLASLRLSLEAVPAIARASVAQPPIVPQPDGTFAFPAVAPGKYRLAVTGGGPWSLRSAIVRGRDVLDLPLEVAVGEPVPEMVVTLADRGTELSGRLVDQLGRPSPDYAVVVFPVDRGLWTVPRRLSGVVKLDADGRFIVTGLPAGQYFLAALTDPDPAQLEDRAYLELLAAAAIEVVLGEGERRVQDVRLAGAGR